MDNMNINIEAKDGTGTVLFGNDVITLEDYSRFTFKTDVIETFVDYCKSIEASPKKVDKTIFFGMETVTLTDTNITYSRDTEPDALCYVKPSPFVGILKMAEGSCFSLREFEELLFTLRPFIDDTGRDLYSYVRNFSASKVTSVKREVDNKGNYNYNVTREKGGATDVEIPETLAFEIPVVSDKIFKRFVFDVYFTWEDKDGGCNVIFKLKNPLLSLEIEKAIKDSLAESMADLTFPKYWGSLVKTLKDDKWKYLPNGLDD
jgi:hypothetical protein